MNKIREILSNYVTGQPVLFSFAVIGHGDMIFDGEKTSCIIDPKTHKIVPIYYHPPGVPFVEQNMKDKRWTTIVRPLQAIYYDTLSTPPRDVIIDVSSIDHMWIAEYIDLPTGHEFSAWGRIEMYAYSNPQSGQVLNNYCFVRSSSTGIMPMTFYPADGLK